ncbi:MAG: DUF3568 family protein [Phycisphaerales bacterium]
MAHGREILRAVLLGAALLAPVACKSTTRTGKSYTLTVDRRLEALLSADLRRAHETALSVVREDYGYVVSRHVADAREGIIEAVTARGNAVKVETFRDGDYITRVRIFVGPLGDEAAMREMLNQIETRLKERR